MEKLRGDGSEMDELVSSWVIMAHVRQPKLVTFTLDLKRSINISQHRSRAAWPGPEKRNGYSRKLGQDVIRTLAPQVFQTRRTGTA